MKCYWRWFHIRWLKDSEGHDRNYFPSYSKHTRIIISFALTNTIRSFYFCKQQLWNRQFPISFRYLSSQLLKSSTRCSDANRNTRDRFLFDKYLYYIWHSRTEFSSTWFFKTSSVAGQFNFLKTNAFKDVLFYTSHTSRSLEHLARSEENMVCLCSWLIFLISVVHVLNNSTWYLAVSRFNSKNNSK